MCTIHLMFSMLTLMSNTLIVTIIHCLSFLKSFNILSFSITSWWYVLQLNFSLILFTFATVLQYIIIFSVTYLWNCLSINFKTIFFLFSYLFTLLMLITQYVTFTLIILALNFFTCSFLKYILLYNFSSLLSNNIIINNIICISVINNLLNCCICLQNMYWWFKTMWHSSIMIWFNCCVTFNQFKYVMKFLLTADSDITNMMAAAFSKHCSFHSVHDILKTLQCHFMSLHNAINETIIIVVLFCLAHINNINNMLLSALIDIIITIRLFLTMITLIVSFWTPQNAASLLIIHFNCASMFIFHNCTHLFILFFFILASNNTHLHFFESAACCCFFTADWKHKN